MFKIKESPFKLNPDPTRKQEEFARNPNPFTKNSKIGKTGGRRNKEELRMQTKSFLQGSILLSEFRELLQIIIKYLSQLFV